MQSLEEIKGHVAARARSNMAEIVAHGGKLRVLDPVTQNERTLRDGDQLAHGMQVKTDATSGFALIRLNNESDLWLDCSTQLELKSTEEGQAPRLKLLKGHVVAIIKKPLKSFQLLFASGAKADCRPGIYDLHSSNTSNQLHVVSGSALLEGDYPKPYPCKAGWVYNLNDSQNVERVGRLSSDFTRQFVDTCMASTSLHQMLRHQLKADVSYDKLRNAKVAGEESVWPTYRIAAVLIVLVGVVLWSTATVGMKAEATRQALAAERADLLEDEITNTKVTSAPLLAEGDFFGPLKDATSRSNATVLASNQSPARGNTLTRITTDSQATAPRSSESLMGSGEFDPNLALDEEILAAQYAEKFPEMDYQADQLERITPEIEIRIADLKNESSEASSQESDVSDSDHFGAPDRQVSPKAPTRERKTPVRVKQRDRPTRFAPSRQLVRNNTPPRLRASSRNPAAPSTPHVITTNMPSTNIAGRPIVQPRDMETMATGITLPSQNEQSTDISADSYETNTYNGGEQYDSPSAGYYLMPAQNSMNNSPGW
jgi:hypothetical protein